MVGIFGEHDPKQMPAHLFWGARSMNFKTAERADISKQNYTVCPRFWYVDATFICRGCGKGFVFSVNEQRFWYEERNFYVDSRPRDCLECRKQARYRLKLKRQYDAEIAKVLRTCPVELKKEIVEIINELESLGDEISEKMKRNRELLTVQIAKQSKSK